MNELSFVKAQLRFIVSSGLKPNNSKLHYRDFYAIRKSLQDARKLLQPGYLVINGVWADESSTIAQGTIAFFNGSTFLGTEILNED